MLPARKNWSLLPRLLFPYVSTKAAWKRGVLRCWQPGLSISISRHKVVLRQVHVLHEKRPIGLRGASYAMDLCNESVRRKHGRRDLVISAHEENAQRVQAVGSSRETHPKKRNLRNEPMKCNRRDAFVRLRISVFRASMWAAAPTIRRYSYIRIVR